MYKHTIGMLSTPTGRCFLYYLFRFQVSFLESELKQKSQQSQQHIEDLVSLQNHLTSLKEQNMQEVEEVKKSALEEVSMVSFVCRRVSSEGAVLGRVKWKVEK